MNYQGAQEARKNMNVQRDIIKSSSGLSLSPLEPITNVVKTRTEWQSF